MLAGRHAEGDTSEAGAWFILERPLGNVSLEGSAVTTKKEGNGSQVGICKNSMSCRGIREALRIAGAWGGKD